MMAFIGAGVAVAKNALWAHQQKKGNLQVWLEGPGIRISKMSAYAGCVLILFQVIYHSTQLIDYSPDLSVKFYRDIFVEVLIGVSAMALPAITFLVLEKFRTAVELTSPFYPILLVIGFSTANTQNDGLAYEILFLFILIPASAIYALIVFVDGWTLKMQADREN